MLSRLSDEELIRRLGSGSEDSPEALKELYSRYLKPIYKYVYLHVGQKQEAEDVTSVVFVKMVKSAPGIKRADNFKAWLYRVARNAVNDYWRERYKVRIVSLDEMTIAGLENPAPPEAASEKAAMIAADILEKLPEKYSGVLKLRVLEGRTLKETAQIMGITVANVKVLQYRALKKAAGLYGTDEKE